MSTYATFRWEFREGNLRERSYVEGKLESVGRPGENAYILTVELVRDEMALPTDGFPLLDPERRVGQRIYVSVVRSREEARVRHLAFLAPVEGVTLAYTLMFETLKAHPEAVAKLGDDFLTELFSKKAARKRPRAVKKKAAS